jgi:hypothetical protein
MSAQIDVNNTTDAIDVYVRQTSGSAKDINGAVEKTWFMASHVGRVS